MENEMKKLKALALQRRDLELILAFNDLAGVVGVEPITMEDLHVEVHGWARRVPPEFAAQAG